AEGERWPWFLEIRPGIAELTYPATLEHQRQQEDDWPARDAANFTVGQPDFGNKDVLEGTGNLVVVVPPLGPPASGARVLGMAGSLRSALARESGGSRLALPAAAAVAPTSLAFSQGGGQAGERKSELEEALPDRVAGSPLPNP